MFKLKTFNIYKIFLSFLFCSRYDLSVGATVRLVPNIHYDPTTFPMECYQLERITSKHWTKTGRRYILTEIILLHLDGMHLTESLND